MRKLLKEEEKDEKYGMGKERSVSEYWKMSGIDFEKKENSNVAKFGGLNEEEFYDHSSYLMSILDIVNKQNKK